ncbi:hypothetical protein [Niveibacterium sp. SC-1]|uniref:hypothetical protein n=1 Tax=Niveibacterium sp. SC-1 TaxID=3135646 RepID=UPI00311E96D3
MQLEKQRDGTWIVRGSAGEVLGQLDDRYGDWVAYADGKTLGICKSRLSAEMLVRAHVARWRR